MKTFVKITGILLIVVIAFAAVASFSARTVSGILGDADNDGGVTILDATRIQRVLVGLNREGADIAKVLGDINGDGLDILDATRIQRYIAGFTTTFPIGQETSAEIVDPTVAPTEAPTQGATSKDPYELPLVD